jgi:hypothetical protein
VVRLDALSGQEPLILKGLSPFHTPVFSPDG